VGSSAELLEISDEILIQMTISDADAAETPRDFLSFCESLWQDWLGGKLEASQFVRRTFDLDAAPEPYVILEPGQKPLVQLLTNPGYTMPHQGRAAVESGSGPLSPVVTYAEVSERLGPFYEKELAHEPAGRRIAAIKKLSALIGTEGVVQVDVCPFHSSSLPHKAELLHEISTDTGFLLKRYVEEVREFLSPRPVVALTAAPTTISLGLEVPLTPWASWLSEIAGLDLASAEFVPLVKKGEKVTVGAFVSSQNGSPKALVQMMGSNNLPRKHCLAILADVLRHHLRLRNS
jgi:hypothetical protein